MSRTEKDLTEHDPVQRPAPLYIQDANSSEADSRGQEQAVRMAQWFAEHSDVSDSVSGSLTKSTSGSAGTWTRATWFTWGSSADQATPLRESDSVDRHEASGRSDRTVLLWGWVWGWLRQSTRSVTCNWNYLSGLKCRERMSMSCIVRFSIRFGKQRYLNFWHGTFISDFIEENLSISFFRTPCTYPFGTKVVLCQFEFASSSVKS